MVSLAMMFNALAFLVFLPAVFGPRRFMCGQDARGQNALLTADLSIGLDPMEGSVYEGCSNGHPCYFGVWRKEIGVVVWPN